MKNKALAILAGLAMFGCTPEWARENNTDQVMHIVGIATTSGGGSGVGGAILNSDVCCPIANDPAVVTIQLTRKNQLAAGVTLGDVYLSRYEVRYFRTDGRSVEGVDVPYRFTGPLNVNLHPATEAHSTGSVTIDLVRHQAKLESPLVNLRQFTVTDTGAFGSSGAGVLTVIAEVTVFGRQVNDRGLSATGQVQINFANYGGDEEQ